MGSLDDKISERKGNGRRIAVVFAINFALLGLIGATFFVQDYRYSLPTPRPAGFKAPALDRHVALPHPDGRPVLMCFASPDCGCSRFNQDHLWDLSRRFGRSVRIIEVIEADAPSGLDSPDETLLDPSGSWAKKCGIYSTPQAVVLDRKDRVVFSGNFNSARFCSENSTQFARLALEAVIAHRAVPPMPASATTPYGCAIVPKEAAR